jgi:hypothetical protein
MRSESFGKSKPRGMGEVSLLVNPNHVAWTLFLNFFISTITNRVVVVRALAEQTSCSLATRAALVGTEAPTAPTLCTGCDESKPLPCQSARRVAQQSRDECDHRISLEEARALLGVEPRQLALQRACLRERDVASLPHRRSPAKPDRPSRAGEAEPVAPLRRDCVQRSTYPIHTGPLLKPMRFLLVPNLLEEGVDPERRVDENVGGAQLGSRFPDSRGNRMKNERLAVPHRKICATVHPDWRLATSHNVAAVISRHLHRKETNMQEMDNFTHPIELSNEELDLVAAGWNQGDRDGSLVNVETGNINVLSGNNIAVLSAGFKQVA